MEHYVTLFDALFLPQGLALHASMERHAGTYTLWILCVDEQTHTILTGLRLPNVRLLRVAEVETAELLAVKEERTRAEYCWTLTPFAPRFVFDAAADVRRVTYLDADVWFRGDPAPIFDEFDASGKDVLITDHAYAPEYDNTAIAGRYCVQFLTVTRVGGETVRKWWEERCIEWCYARFEDGKIGDQKYLDDWPERFGQWVHVLSEKELAQGPWNATRFPYSSAIFYHFHSLRIISARRIALGDYVLPVPVLMHVYQPYLRELRAALRVLDDCGLPLQPQARPPGIASRLNRTLGRISMLARTQVPRQISRW